ncbi:protein phosphatase 1 regulatory subunit 36 [Labrus bergylta]|uniref:protein phosphatase 1 regulatory subunit 36 n=1 Tax=Labrus bergylta TaxID=56723 RepID=UPI00331445FA
MPKHPEETRNVSVSPPGCWMWSDEAQTVEFISSCPAEEAVPRERKQTNSPFRELQLRSEWLAGVSTLTHRGRQSSRKTLSPEHLNAYRSSVMKRQGDHVTIDDVKQVAVSLLQENYSLPIPLCFLALLKRKELDDVLTALLLYLSCFFEHRSLENKSELLLADIIKERQVTAAALAKKAMAQKQLAVCYFSLIMDLEVEQHQRTSYRKSRTSSNRKEWLLHACLYSFFCYVAWVTFGRKDLKDIQEEVGRLFYSDTLNTSVRNGADGDPEVTSSSVDGSVKTGEADPEETGSNRPFKRRSCQRRPPLSSIANQRSPLMVCLLPSPKDLSPHLFLAGRARRRSPLPADHCDITALTEELNQQLADVSLGILGKPLCQLSGSDLIPLGEKQKQQ